MRPFSGRGGLLSLLCLILCVDLSCLQLTLLVCLCLLHSFAASHFTSACCRFDDFGGLDSNGKPVTTVPKEVLDSIRRNQVCLKGTLFTPLSKTTATESLNVQMRKNLDSHINLVHGFSLKGLPPGVIRHQDIDIVVIRCVLSSPASDIHAHAFSCVILRPTSAAMHVCLHELCH